MKIFIKEILSHPAEACNTSKILVSINRRNSFDIDLTPIHTIFFVRILNDITIRCSAIIKGTNPFANKITSVLKYKKYEILTSIFLQYFKTEVSYLKTETFINVPR